MRIREPFPWEPQQQPRDVPALSPVVYVLMPDRQPAAPAVMAEGEFDCRHTIDKMRDTIYQHTGDRGYADRHAREAAANWDRGVRAGSIQRKE